MWRKAKSTERFAQIPVTAGRLAYDTNHVKRMCRPPAYPAPGSPPSGRCRVKPAIPGNAGQGLGLSAVKRT